MLRVPAARAVGRRHAVCSRMLTYAHVCSRMQMLPVPAARGVGRRRWPPRYRRSLQDTQAIYLSIYVCVCVYVYIYICIYICARDVEVAPYKCFRLPYELEELLLP